VKTGKLLLIYAGLLALLAIGATVAIQFPQWALVALACAAGQAALVLFGLAQLGAHSALVRFFALGAGFWLVLMFTLSLTDLLTRSGVDKL
jgi:cytochrome c oxidase subunit 4